MDDLVWDLIGVVDLARSPAVEAQLERALRRLDAVKIASDPGAPFDPRLQNAVERRVGRPASAGRIAEVLRAGWRQGEVLLRPADVAVWAAAADVPAEQSLGQPTGNASEETR
ncbi:MAG: nucleotide exchange factor GrpE [Actinomycetota bacterium]